jgi:hypothetical protein
MGKYTSLARNLKEDITTPQEEVFVRNTNVKINTKEHTKDSNPPKASAEEATPLRPTTLTTLIGREKDETRSVRCIHNMTATTCGVCSGYARWLAEDEGRLRRALADPDAARREFWRAVRGAS